MFLYFLISLSNFNLLFLNPLFKIYILNFLIFINLMIFLCIIFYDYYYLFIHCELFINFLILNLYSLFFINNPKFQNYDLYFHFKFIANIDFKLIIEFLQNVISFD